MIVPLPPFQLPPILNDPAFKAAIGHMLEPKPALLARYKFVFVAGQLVVTPKP